MQRRMIVSIIGNAACCEKNCSPEDKMKWQAAFDLGKTLVDNGYRVMTGGGRGVMRAAMAGAHASSKYREGDTIAIAPTFDNNEVNDYADIVIPTGLNFYRDVIMAASDVVVAVGGGAGTLHEISGAWKLKRMVIAYSNIQGWSSKVAGEPLDNSHTDMPKDIVYPVTNANEVIELIKRHAHKYNKCFSRLPIGYPEYLPKLKSNWVGPVSSTKIKKL
jgi:uncharacterized protein (TIGR00725 family)